MIFERRSYGDFYEYKMSLGLYNGEKSAVQLSCCHDLHTSTIDGIFVLKRTTIPRLMYLTQTGVSLHRGHYIKGNHPFRNTVLLKFCILPRYIGGLKTCYKVYIVEDMALLCKPPY